MIGSANFHFDRDFRIKLPVGLGALTKHQNVETRVTTKQGDRTEQIRNLLAIRQLRHRTRQGRLDLLELGDRLVPVCGARLLASAILFHLRHALAKLAGLHHPRPQNENVIENQNQERPPHDHPELLAGFHGKQALDQVLHDGAS